MTQVVDGAIRTALKMRKPPQHLADDAAQEDMIRQIVAIVSKRAPKVDVTPWVGEVIEAAMIKGKGHTWPSLDIWARASGAAATQGETRAGPELSATEASFRVFVNHIQNQRAVAEPMLFSAFADRALRDGLIRFEDLRRYQRAAFDARRKFYGDASAFKWLDEKNEALAHELREQRGTAGHSGLRDPSEPGATG